MVSFIKDILKGSVTNTLHEWRGNTATGI